VSDFLVPKVKVQSCGRIKCCKRHSEGGGIQYSVSYVELRVISLHLNSPSFQFYMVDVL